MCQYVTTHATRPETHRYCHLPRPETETREANEQLLIPIWRRRHICIPFFDNIFYLSTWLSSYFSALLYFKYKGILVIKNSTESRAISPGKNRYMASFRPIASPTCSIRIPSVPVKKVSKCFKKSHFTSDDIHDEDEECCWDSSGGGGDNLHNDCEQDGKPGLGEEVVKCYERAFVFCCLISSWSRGYLVQWSSREAWGKEWGQQTEWQGLGILTGPKDGNGDQTSSEVGQWWILQRPHPQLLLQWNTLWSSSSQPSNNSEHWAYGQPASQYSILTLMSE